MVVLVIMDLTRVVLTFLAGDHYFMQRQKKNNDNSLKKEGKGASFGCSLFIYIFQSYRTMKKYILLAGIAIQGSLNNTFHITYRECQIS